jgi:hypothetical protein
MVLDTVAIETLALAATARMSSNERLFLFSCADFGILALIQFGPVIAFHIIASGAQAEELIR